MNFCPEVINPIPLIFGAGIDYVTTVGFALVIFFAHKKARDARNKANNSNNK